MKIRLSRTRLCMAAFFISGMTFSTLADNAEIQSSESSGIVYIVFAVDTEPARIPPWEEHPALDFACFDAAGDNGRVAAVMDEEWRRSHRDSYGGLPRFTWFVLSHEALFHAPGGSGTIVYDTLMKFKNDIEKFGDEIGWHYHHADWTDLDRDGKSSWNQLTTFDGTGYAHGSDIEIAERSLNALLVERHFFPTVFRGGWTWEDNGLSRWLENIIPFDYSANPPNVENTAISEPLRNIYDWAGSPSGYEGYHPARSDYRKPGTMHRRVFRTIAPNNEHEWAGIFRRAAAGGDQILCFTAHTYDNIREDIDGFLDRLLFLADSLDIRTMFAAASGAAAAVSGTLGDAPPRISMTCSENGVSIRTEGPIFQRSPYCAARDTAGNYTRVPAFPEGPGQWRIDRIPGDFCEVVCAIGSQSGVSATATTFLK